jgi:altronate dehydratase large subunit
LCRYGAAVIEDIESISGMVAGGAQVVIFTTGRGTPTGNPIAPVIKITANEETFNRMKDNIDIVAVANGKTTKAEDLNHHEFSIYKIAPSF